MKALGIIRWNGLFFLAILAGLFLLEFYGKIFERGLGHYLKWQNSERPQLGRIWERDRQAVVAQNKIRSIRSSLDSREESTLAIGSLKQLFEQVGPSFPLVVSRKKFLQLYYDFPGQWSRRIVSPYELIRIDAEKSWDRVLLNWTHGTSYYRDREVYRLEMPHSDSERFYPMYNLQQQYMELYLIEKAETNSLIELRWQSRVTPARDRSSRGAPRSASW